MILIAPIVVGGGINPSPRCGATLPREERVKTRSSAQVNVNVRTRPGKNACCTIDYRLSTIDPSSRRLLGGLVASGLIGLAAYRRGSLSRSGVAGAMLTGTTIFAGGGLAPSALL